MAGARFFADVQKIKPDVAVIGEPTSLVPVVRHKGHMSLRISVEGKSGHSSKPSAGANAIEIIYQVIGELMALKAKLERDFSNTQFDVPAPTLNMGAINGGHNANRICGLIDLAEEISGCVCCAVNYATEGPFLQQLGAQTVVMGPGSI